MALKMIRFPGRPSRMTVRERLTNIMEKTLRKGKGKPMKMKRMTAALAVFILCLVMTAPAFAAGGTLTVKGTANGDTYGVYQIVSGDIKNGYTWGDGISEAGKEMLGNPSEAAKQLSGSDQETIIATLKAAIGTPTAQETATDEVRFTGLTSGVYVVCDMTRVDDFRVKLLMGSQVIDLFDEKQDTGATQPQNDARKETAVETEKVIINQTVSCGNASGRAVSAGIGEGLTYTIEGKLSDHLDAYGTYGYAINCLPGEGITLNAESVAAEIDGSPATGQRVTREEDGSVTVAWDNVKATGAQNGARVSVTMDGALNHNAVIGSGGNITTVTATAGEEPMVSEASQTAVYTFALDGTVADSETKAGLSGAGFRLYRQENDGFFSGILALFGWEPREYLSSDGGFAADEAKALIVTSDETGHFTAPGLGSGKYFLEETKAPEGYDGIKSPEAFEIQSSFLGDGTAAFKLISQSGDSAGNAETGTISLVIDNRRINDGGVSSGAIDSFDASNATDVPEATPAENHHETTESAKDSASSSGDDKTAPTAEVKPTPTPKEDASVQTQNDQPASQTVAPATTPTVTPSTAPAVSAAPKTTIASPEPSPSPSAKKDNARTGGISRTGSFALVAVLLIAAAVIYAIWKRRDDDDVAGPDHRD